nr:hypothetical protein [Lachnospiraceae bacterium]
MEKQLHTFPEGTLKIKEKHGKTYFYRQVKKAKGRKEIYIKRQDVDVARQLAQKTYLQKVCRVLGEQLQALNVFARTYNDTAIEQIYDEFPHERKQLIKPLAGSVWQKLKEWKEEVYEPYNTYPEYKIYETDRGEMVRSKSEVIIANLLYQYRKDMDYKYERPLILKEKNGKEITVHPDFTLISRRTGNIYYYEHAGKIDDPKYAMDFVKKIELYVANDILQGRNLLITYETAGAPLSVNCVRKVVEMCI